MTVPSGRDGGYDVLLVGEALGEAEAKEGAPFVGAAGYVLNDCIGRAGLDREKFSIANAVWCRPPNNRLEGTPLEAPAVAHCTAHHLLPLIQELRPKVIVPLGNVPYGVFSDGAKGIITARGYAYPWRNSIILPSIHPSYIQRGNTNYSSILIHDLQRAVQLAQDGWHPCQTHYLLDPTPEAAHQWVDRALADPEAYVSFDIETPDKHESEDESELRLDGPIIRISFSMTPYHGLSIPFTKKMRPVVEKALGSPHRKVVWNAAFDVPRLEAKGIHIAGEVFDGMIAWHVLHSELPKGLGFVSTFLCPDQPRWKHLSRRLPAYYNAVDSDVALRITLETFKLLRKVEMWEVYNNQIQRMEPIYAKMRDAGMPIDPTIRRENSLILEEEYKKLLAQVHDAVPVEVQPRKVYKQYAKAVLKYPEGHDITIHTTVQRCSACGKEGKLTVKHPCVAKKGAQLIPHQVEQVAWEVILPFVPSPQAILKYQDHKGHVSVKRKGKATTDEVAVRRLMVKHPDDTLYPLLLEEREIKKLRGTYIGKITPEGDIKGGIPTEADNRVRIGITNNPATLRTSMGYLQQIPRGGGRQRLVKNMFVAPKGSAFFAADFSGIEALLVGYFSNSKTYMRLSRLGIHDFANAYALHELDKVIPASDLPQLEWSDADLRESLQSFKRRFKKERNTRKRLVHGRNYRMGIFKAQEVLLKELGIVVPIKDIRHFFHLYDELFPEIIDWHKRLCHRVDGWDEEADPGQGISAGAGWVRAPTGFIHRYYQVLTRRRLPDGTWTWGYGEGSKALVAFNPQHSAAAIGKDALWNIEQDDPELAEWVRLFIHDEILGEAPASKVEEAAARVSAIMRRPVPWLGGLQVDVEAKVGPSWAEMQEIEV